MYQNTPAPSSGTRMPPILTSISPIAPASMNIQANEIRMYQRSGQPNSTNRPDPFRSMPRAAEIVPCWVFWASNRKVYDSPLVFATSYTVLPLPDGSHAAPDWLLGSLFGLGGLAGMYLGAATQKHVPQNALKLGVGLLLCGLGGAYLWPV